MPNNFFQFKKFTIRQDKSSMKVCTDSCLFGAWIASKIEQGIYAPKTILDIGTGTGLLSLMLVQKTTAFIDAVEIDGNSYKQANENFNESPWKNQLQIFHADIKTWNDSHTYDLIVCNPPFFENDLLPQNEGKNISKHSSKLNLEELLVKGKNLLNEDGRLAILLPWSRTNLFENTAAKNNFFIKEKIEVKQTVTHNFFRTMLILQAKETDTVKSILSIKDDKNEYTPEFSELLKDYYLFL